MRLELMMGLLVLVVAAVAAEKTKHRRPATSPESDHPMPQPADGKIPFNPHPQPHHPGKGKGHIPAGHGHKRPHQKGHGGGKSHQVGAALKEEIARIKASDLPEDQKADRLQALRMRVKEGQMLQSMPPEIRARHEELQATLSRIYHDESLTEEEKNQQIAEEKAKFKAAVASLKDSMSPEQIEEMREERKKTIEGHTAAAMAARQAGQHKKAREYHRQAREAAKGIGLPRKRSTSRSQPNFF